MYGILHSPLEIVNSIKAKGRNHKEEIDMEWIKSIMEKHTDAEGKVDMTAAMAEVNTEFPKNAVPKETFNQKNEDLKTANKLVEELKSVDAEGLQKKIEEHEEAYATLTAERESDKRTFDLTSKLKDAGAKDIDYMIYKLGDTTIDDLDNKLKEFKEESPAQFDEAEETAPVDTKGFTVIDNKLEAGQAPDEATVASNAFEAALGL